jgi:c-di-GMP-binding flagellar brake protein YcgR
MTRGLSAALAIDDLAELSAVESRDGQREVIRVDARLRLPGGATLETKTIDISHDGIGFFSSRLLPQGEDCPVFVDLSARGAQMELHVVGRICHCQEQASGKYRVGLQFVELDADASELLAAVLG